MSLEQNLLNQNIKETIEPPNNSEVEQTKPMVEASNTEEEQRKTEEINQRKKENNEKIEKVKNDILKQFGVENTETENKIKEGVDLLFKQNPDLVKIGTKEQYSEYLNSIFPDSKVKDIFYHASGAKNITQFLPGKLDIGIHFGTKNAAEYRGTKRENVTIYPVVLDVKSILETKDLSIWTSEYVFNELKRLGLVNESDFGMIEKLYNKEGKLNLRNNGQDATYDWLQEKSKADAIKYVNTFEDKGSESYIVFKPEQIHTLGNSQDVENFKEFVSKDKKE